MRKIIWILFVLIIVTFTFPFQIVPGINLNISDFLFLIVFIMVMLENIFKLDKFMPLFNRNYWYIFTMILLLGVGSLISALFSNNTITNSVNFFQYLFIFSVLLTTIEYLIDFKIKNAIIMFLLTIIPGLLLSIIVLLSYFQVYNGLDEIILSANGRYQGFEGIATEFGNKIALYLIISLFSITYFKSIVVKVLFVIISLIFTYVSLLSGSFGAGLILYAIFLLYLLIGLRNRIIPKVIGIFSLFFIIYQYYAITINQNYIILQFLPQIMHDRFLSFGNNFGSINERLDINTIAFQDFLNSPLVGVGYGQYSEYNEMSLSVHNTFLSAAVEIGIFGLIGVLLYVFLPILMSGRMYIATQPFKDTNNFFGYLFIYSVVRFVNTFKAQEYIDREPWIIILIIFVLYSNRNRLARNIPIKE